MNNELDRFESELRIRLAERWSCSAPAGLTIECLGLATAFFPHELPSVYKRFLLVCGQHAGELFFEYEWQANKLQMMNERMLKYADYAGISPPNLVFTFLDYIGDYFWCFCADDPDPEVLMFDHCEFSNTGFPLSSFLLKWEQHETPRGA